jgi:hypothetical protein
MRILHRIVRAFKGGERYDVTPIEIGTLPLRGGSGDWRSHKLTEAAQKYGKPFKCAGEHMPREILMRDRIIERDGDWARQS